MAIDITVAPIDDPELDEDSVCDNCNRSMENGDECYCERCWGERQDVVDNFESKVGELEDRIKELEESQDQARIQELENKLYTIRRGVRESCAKVLSLDRKLFQVDGVPIWDENWNLNI